MTKRLILSAFETTKFAKPPIFIYNYPYMKIKNTFPILFILCLLVQAAAPVKKNVRRLYRVIRAKYLPIGTAPRAFAQPGGRHIYFTEKSKPGSHFGAGSVYRKLYRIKIGRTRSQVIADMGCVLDHPLIDTRHKRVFYSSRMTDSNRDGRVSFSDKAMIYSVSFSDLRKTAWTAGKNFRLMAISPDCQNILLMEKNYLYSLDIHSSGQLSFVVKCTGRPAAAFYDGKNRLIWENQSGRKYIVEKGTSTSLKGPLFHSVNKTAVIYSTRRKSGIRLHKRISGKHVYSFPSRGIRYLFSLGRLKDVFLDETPGRRKVFIGNGAAGTYQDLFRFPFNVTRAGLSADRMRIAYLVTYDTDKDNRLLPASLDRSALYYVEIGNRE